MAEIEKYAERMNSVRETAGQRLLFDPHDIIPFPEMVAINSQKTAEKLFSEYDFRSLSGVTYIASLKLIDDYFVGQCFETIELVIGDSVTEAGLRDELKRSDDGVTDRLARRCQDGSLRILLPSKTDHSKFYLLENDRLTRIIFGSANFTSTGLGGRQRNSVMVWDLPPVHPFVTEFRKYFEENHKAGCTLFMEDLARLLNDGSEEKRGDIIRQWVELAPEETDREAAAILQDITMNALEHTTADNV